MYKIIFTFCLILGPAFPALAFDVYPSQQYVTCMKDKDSIDCLIAEGDRVEVYFQQTHDEFMSSKLATESFKLSDRQHEEYLEACFNYMEKLYESGILQSVSGMKINIYETSRRAVFLKNLSSLKADRADGMDEELEMIKLDCRAAYQKLADEIAGIAATEERKKMLISLLEESENKWIKYLQSTEAYLKEQKGDGASNAWLIEAYGNRIKIYGYMRG